MRFEKMGSPGRTGSDAGTQATTSAAFAPPAWLTQIRPGPSHPREDLQIKEKIYRYLAPNHHSPEDKKSMIDTLLDRIEDAGKSDLLPEVLRHLDDDALVQHTYRRVDEKLEALPQPSLRTVMLYKSGGLSEAERAAFEQSKTANAFYRKLESRISDINEARVRSILSAGNSQQKLAKLTRHLQDRNFISPTLQHREDLQKIFSSFTNEADKAEAYNCFHNQVKKQLRKLGKRPETLQERKEYLSHAAGVLTTFHSLTSDSPGRIPLSTLYEFCSNSPAREGRHFKAEHSYAAVEALASHMPKMKSKMRGQFLDHVNFQLHALKFLDDAFGTVRKEQVNKMVTAVVLGAPGRTGRYPDTATSNFARINDKKARQDMIKLVYKNRHALTPENKAAMMDVFRQYKDDVTSGSDHSRWSGLRIFTRGGRTLNRMKKIE